MLNVDDLVSDADLFALDVTARTDFGQDALIGLADKRRLAVQEFVTPALEQAGLPAERHLLRYTPDAAFHGPSLSALTDITALVSDGTGIDLAVAISTPASSAIYLGYSKPFRGAWAALDAGVNTTPGVSSIAVWDGGQWAGVNGFVDGTTVVSSSLAFSGGGRLTWTLPSVWERKRLNGEETYRYWARLQMSARPAVGAVLSQLLPIRSSRLTAPCAYYALALLYQEGWGSNRGDWKDKSAVFFKMAEGRLSLALQSIRDEFDMDNSNMIETADADDVPADKSIFSIDRG